MKRQAKRAYGVPLTKGGLTITHADGTETYIPGVESDRAARRVVRDSQGPGRAGRNM